MRTSCIVIITVALLTVALLAVALLVPIHYGYTCFYRCVYLLRIDFTDCFCQYLLTIGYTSTYYGHYLLWL